VCWKKRGGESGRCRWRSCIATSRRGGRGGIREITQIACGVGGAHAVAIRGGCGQAGVRESVAPVVAPFARMKCSLRPCSVRCGSPSRRRYRWKRSTSGRSACWKKRWRRVRSVPLAELYRYQPEWWPRRYSRITQITSGVGGAYAIAIGSGCGQAGVRESGGTGGGANLRE